MISTHFWQGVGQGLLLSAAGALSFTLLAPLLGQPLALRGLISLLGLAYLALLLRDPRTRIGRSVVLASWLLTVLLLIFLQPRLLDWLLAQTGLIWLVRSLCLHDRLWKAIADAALNGLALVTALACLQYTHNLFLTLWCFFLLQALHPLLSAIQRRPALQPDATAANTDRFELALHHANASLRRLANRH